MVVIVFVVVVVFVLLLEAALLTEDCGDNSVRVFKFALQRVKKNMN